MSLSSSLICFFIIFKCRIHDLECDHLYPRPQAAIDDFVKCLNKKADTKSISSFSGDIMRSIEYLRERKDNLLRVVGGPDVTYNSRLLHRDGPCFCCDTEVVMPQLPEESQHHTPGVDKVNTLSEIKTQKPKRKTSGDRVLCYPGLPPSHDLDARQVYFIIMGLTKDFNRV